MKPKVGRSRYWAANEEKRSMTTASFLSNSVRASRIKIKSALLTRCQKDEPSSWECPLTL